MINVQNIVHADYNLTVDGSDAGFEIDTNNASYLVVQVFGSGGAGAAFTNCKLQESDASGSGQADISGATASITTPGSGEDEAYFFVDLRGRKRYITVVADPGESADLHGMPRLRSLPLVRA
jgi:hypothetical protein